MTKTLHITFERLSTWWCGLKHRSITWPVHGYYVCTNCGRRYQVQWAAQPEAGAR